MQTKNRLTCWHVCTSLPTIAFQVRRNVAVLPHVDVGGLSTDAIVAGTDAVAAPVLAGVVGTPHSTVAVGGQVIVNGVQSTTHGNKMLTEARPVGKKSSPIPPS